MTQAYNLYYAHSMKLYRTPLERSELSQISFKFSDHFVINPRDHEGLPEKKANKMEYCKKLVGTCKTLVFTRWEGEITAGVVTEANHALSLGLDVFELANGEFIRQRTEVNGLTLEQTL